MQVEMVLYGHIFYASGKWFHLDKYSMQVEHGFIWTNILCKWNIVLFGQIFYASGTWFHLDKYSMQAEHGFIWTNILCK